MSAQLPRYADIVNYLAYGIMPPDFNYQQKRKLRTNTKSYIYGMTYCCLEDGHIILSEDVCQKMSKVELLINVMHHHMEDTLQKKE